MKYDEIEKDLFTVDESYYFAQCISADFAMRAGIAAQFNKHFDTKQKLKEHYGDWLSRWEQFPEERGTCILEGRVFNLITKMLYWQKPTYETMQKALNALWLCVNKNPDVRKLAMPRIGCGLDRLEWNIVSEMIKETFKDDDITILVCSRELPERSILAPQ